MRQYRSRSSSAGGTLGRFASSSSLAARMYESFSSDLAIPYPEHVRARDMAPRGIAPIECELPHTTPRSSVARMSSASDWPTPGGLDMRDEAGHEDEIQRAGPEHLVGDADRPAARVSSVRHHRLIVAVVPNGSFSATTGTPGGPSLGSPAVHRSAGRWSDGQAVARLNTRAATHTARAAMEMVIAAPVTMAGSPHIPLNAARTASTA
jgi:hypothetical protein